MRCWSGARQSVRAVRPLAKRWSSTRTPVADPAEAPAETAGSAAEPAIEAMREAMRTLSYAHPASQELSPTLREQLSREFQQFVQEFVHDVDMRHDEAEYLAGTVQAPGGSLFGADVQEDGNLTGARQFSGVVASEPGQPYSDAEMYVRQVFHAHQALGLGAEIRDVYRPHEDLHRPATIAQTGLSALLAAGAHLGHATHRLRATCAPFVYGEREGIHIIDLQQTLTALRQAARVIEQVANKGGLVLFVGTRDGHARTVEAAAARAHGFYVHRRWLAGTFTNFLSNATKKQQVARVEVDMADRPTGRALSTHLTETIIKPDVVVVLNPIENRALLAECIKTRIPTVGIVDTDSEPSLLTYAVPGNDDSLRFADLVAGVLSNAAARGRDTRHAEFARHEKTKASLRAGTARDARDARESADARFSTVTEAEQQLDRA